MHLQLLIPKEFTFFEFTVNLFINSVILYNGFNRTLKCFS